ncbi:unnamed protein product, partial [Mesorhabditis belari]|uniref:Uncharacterized protein n=1 Tax=Mesorhabditis belari TaxID=2138241 RepID=A0AAF3EKN9_9BILA
MFFTIVWSDSYKKTLFYKFGELLSAIILAIILQALSHFLGVWNNGIPLNETLPDMTEEFYQGAIRILFSSINVTQALALLITPFAIWGPLRNNRLTLPIRLQAINQSAARALMVVLELSVDVCKLLNYYFPQKKKKQMLCPNHFWQSIEEVSKWIGPLHALAQFSQLMISISRFFAVSFEGRYFETALRLPYLQLLIPYLYCYTYYYLDLLFNEEQLQPWAFLKEQADYFPYFLQLSFDYMVYRKMKMVKHAGKKVSRAEALLLIQMVANSICVIISWYVQTFLQAIVSLYFGPTTYWFITNFGATLHMIMFEFGIM